MNLLDLFILFQLIYFIQCVDEKILKRNRFNPTLQNDIQIRNRRTNFPCGQSFIPCDEKQSDLIAAFGVANFQTKDQSNFLG